MEHSTNKEFGTDEVDYNLERGGEGLWIYFLQWLQN